MWLNLIIGDNGWPAATAFIYDSLVELRDDCMGLGQPLIMRKGLVTDILNNIRHQFDIDGIYAHEETSNLWDISVMKTYANGVKYMV